jgi:Protein of unknown function (DUF3667)
METTCKNCGNHSDETFCGSCGQKMHVHRFDTKHIFLHEIPHGIVHLDKGFLLTSKALLTRPGHFIREYIEGKRVNHYGPIQYLFIVGIVIGLLMGLFNYNKIMSQVNNTFGQNKTQTEQLKTNKTPEEIIKEKKKQEKIVLVQQKVFNTISQQYKWFIFIMIPASALAGFWITKKFGYNFAENIVRALYTSGLNGIFSIVTAPMMSLPSLIVLHSVISFALSFIVPTVVWNQFLKPRMPDRTDRFLRIFLYWVYQVILIIVTVVFIGIITVLFTYKELKSA